MTTYIMDTTYISAEQLDCMAEVLPAERRASAARYLHHSDRVESIASAYIMLYALCTGKTDTGIVNMEIDHLIASVNEVSELAARIGWTTGKNGKPFEEGVLIDHTLYHVNLSHSGGLVAAAVALTPIGIDVQRISDIPLQRMLKISSRFSPNERARLESVPVASFVEQFFSLWACKESVMKLCGKGFSLPLSKFSVENNECILEGRRIKINVNLLQNAYFASAQFV